MHENLRNTEDKRQSVFEVALRVAMSQLTGSDLLMLHSPFPSREPSATSVYRDETPASIRQARRVLASLAPMETKTPQRSTADL